MRKSIIIILFFMIIGEVEGIAVPNKEPGKLTPFATLNPPADITPAKTNYDNGWYSPPK